MLYAVECWQYDGCNGWYDNIVDDSYTESEQEATKIALIMGRRFPEDRYKVIKIN